MILSVIPLIVIRFFCEVNTFFVKICNILLYVNFTRSIIGQMGPAVDAEIQRSAVAFRQLLHGRQQNGELIV